MNFSLSKRRQTARKPREPRLRRTLALEVLEQRRLLTVGPAVDSVDPLANSHTAPLDTDVSVIYDQEIDPASVSDATLVVHSMQSGQLLEPENAFSVSGSTITLEAAGDLKAGELVQATATADVQNLAGEGTATPFVWQFRTEATSGTAVFLDSDQDLANSDGHAVAVGDLDGDGDLDAFVGNVGPDFVWFNEGNGSFTDSGQRLGDSESSAVALGDLDGDGDLDAFVANWIDSDKVWLNDGQGNFTDSGQNLGDAQSRSVAVADLDGDGDLDVFVAYTSGLPNLVWLNDGQGNFAYSGQDLGSSDSRAVALGDLDSDGDLDAMVGNWSWEPNEVWLNDGQGHFSDSGQRLGNLPTLGLALGDLDGDGDLDAFCANSSYELNDVWLNDGQGSFTNSGQSLGAGSYSRTVALGDLDADGDLDAFVGNHPGGPDTVWLNDGQGTFTDSGQRLGESYSKAVALGDLDGDADLDAFVACFTQSDKVWLNQGGPTTPMGWPDGWESMEIEAKWTTTEFVLQTIMADFSMNEPNRKFTVADTTEHYDTQLRWNGCPRKFIDYYYDNPSQNLSDALHTLRHRTREEWNGAGTAPDFGDDLSDLIDYPEWEESWQKVQYKGTPARFGAAWMRDESGNAQLTSEQVTDTLNGETLAVHEGDDPVAHAEADHPELVWMDDAPFPWQGDPITDFVLVVDFRYRVEFLDRDTGEVCYELSLDKARRYEKDVNGEYTVYDDFFEVELEALPGNGDDGQAHTQTEIDELFRLVNWFEHEYPVLEPSTTSKAGGNEVADSGPYSYWDIYGSVWDDADQDGIQDPGEIGVPGVTVHLLDDSLSTVATTAADVNGFYGFRGLSVFEYVLEFVALPGTLFTQKDQGDDDTLDSDADPATGRTAPFLLGSGESADRDAGFYGSLPAGRVGGLVWSDLDGGGIQGPQETGVGDVTVTLLDSELAEISTTTTTADGSYSFDGLESGWYCLEFAAPADSTLSPMNQGSDDLVDSDANRSTGRTAPFYMITGQDAPPRDAGFYDGPFSADLWNWLRVSEIMYAEPQFIELKNVGAEPLDLTDVRFIDGIDFDFTSGSLTSLFPDEHVVLIRDLEEFARQYDTHQINIAGEYERQLRGERERIELVGPTNRIILVSRYDPEWFVLVKETDAFSLTVVDELADPTAWEQRSNWRPSSLCGGSPGADDPRLVPDPGVVVINEIMTNPSDGYNDWIELHNTTSEAIDIGGWYLGDDVKGEPVFKRYRIAPNTVIPAGGYLAFTREDHFGNSEDPGCIVAFGLNAGGERLQLTAGDTQGHLLGYSESVIFGPSESDVTFGPYGTDFIALSRPTAGGENASPKVGPVVINEIMYRPGASGSEFIELCNISPGPVDVGEWDLDGIGYSLPPDTVIPEHGFLLVVPTYPQGFRFQYAIPDEIPIVGPYGGTLDNAGEDLRLYKAGPGILVDPVNYNDKSPWPEEADLGGRSLERVFSTWYGNDPANWNVTTIFGGTPGQRNSTAGIPSWIWDELGDGYWDDTDGATGAFRWVDTDGSSVFQLPDEFTNTVVRTDTVTVSLDSSARDLTVASGTIQIPANATLELAGKLDIHEGAELTCELDDSGNGLINTADVATLAGTLTLRAVGSLGDPSAQEWGYYARTIVRANGGLVGTFDSTPAPGQHIGFGVFVVDPDGDGQGIIYDTNTVGVDLFQAAPGDTDGDRDVDISDIMNILAGGKFGDGPSDATWLDGNFDGDLDVDISDIMKILAAGLFDTGSYAPVALVNGESAGHDLVTSLANLRIRNQLLSLVLDAKQREFPTTTSRQPHLAAVTSQDAPTTAVPVAHDAVLQQAVDLKPGGKKTSIDKWVWLYEYEQPSVYRPAANDRTEVEKAVDKLLAISWQ